jgi:uncharacterized protein YbcI
MSMSQNAMMPPVETIPDALGVGTPVHAGLTLRGVSWAEEVRITEGQLEAIAMRCRAELDHSLRRTGTGTVTKLAENVLTVRVEHSLAAAEHQLMRRADGRAFFQHYIEELAEQMYPEFRRHVEQILPCTVTFTRVTVDCERDSIVFAFGLRPGR